MSLGFKGEVQASHMNLEKTGRLGGISQGGTVGRGEKRGRHQKQGDEGKAGPDQQGQ